MSVAASRPPAPVVVPAPLPVPTPADREPAAHPFAEMLRQNRGLERPAVGAAKPRTADIAAAPAEPSPAPTAAGDENVPMNDSTPKSDAGRARARAGATPARSAARPTGAAEHADRGAERGVERGAQDDDRSPADASSVAANPALALRPDTTRPADPELRVGSAAHRSPLTAGAERDADAAATASAATESGADPGSATARRTDAATRADTGRAAGRTRDGDAASPAASFAQILADAKAADRPAAAATASADAPLPAPTAIGAHEPQPSSTTDNALAPPTATLPVPVDSPEFAAAFGVQVSVFVREGVQQAELYLNPAETGPVSIAITVEGSQARVEFGADLAATRQAIEDGLPALASALRDAGFTLAGGGVAQHSRSGGSGPGGDEAAGRGRDDRRAIRSGEALAAPAVQRASVRVAAGGIDLYA
jgi:hypothetical protein